MKGFVANIEERTVSNDDFRRVIYTGPHIQLVLMTLQAGDDIGEEVHSDTDQFFRIEGGTGEVVVDGKTSRIEGATAIVVPAGARHNVRNTGKEPLRLYTLYAPPHHEDGTVQHTKADAEGANERFTGATTEQRRGSMAG